MQDQRPGDELLLDALEKAEWRYAVEQGFTESERDSLRRRQREFRQQWPEARERIAASLASSGTSTPSRTHQQTRQENL
jgi:hypothetical protein